MSDLVIAGVSRIKGAHEGIGASKNIDAWCRDIIQVIALVIIVLIKHFPKCII